MKAISILDKLLAWATLLLFTALLAVVVIQILGRYLPYNAIWTEELSRYLFVYAITTAAPLALRKNEFIRVDMVLAPLKEKTKRLYESIILGLVFAFSVVLFVEGIRFYQLGLDFIAPTMGFSMSYVYAAVPLLAFLIMVYSLVSIVDRTRPLEKEGNEE
ncbi:TRAP transporter small permease [Shouchella clausii]|jgi:TRAP-type transport system small permease protein|uniref:TRAP-type transport system permease small protein n=3 Tax=Shouchella TaxID=2893057 RepID=Q5WAN4_SHOC1|nr:MULTISPECIES: TRAP transporter small permease [Shouchella]MCM3311384.1 TRAP transporter small permease [Psychrobacillus sp. MER TA 17]PAD42462.1 TRAP transporter permease DctQ [Bacillus sp. 7520-S]ALA52963.1 TRAP-type C4-dicarboxylate transport system, small permease component [Shouchella clausii]KKI86613.1 TRAP-type transport system permease small protein [Shouchella clausii]MBU3231476.1 TRAP transporter small permease [Shouchella clausii]